MSQITPGQPGSPDGPPKRPFTELVFEKFGIFVAIFAFLTLATLIFGASWWAILWLFTNFPG